MESSHQQSSGRYLLTLSLGALGVVYGDIGTSPLYAFRECFRPEHHLRHTPDNILGIISRIATSGASTTIACTSKAWAGSPEMVVMHLLSVGPSCTRAEPGS